MWNSFVHLRSQHIFVRWFLIPHLFGNPLICLVVLSANMVEVYVVKPWSSLCLYGTFVSTIFDVSFLWYRNVYWMLTFSGPLHWFPYLLVYLFILFIWFIPRLSGLPDHSILVKILMDSGPTLEITIGIPSIPGALFLPIALIAALLSLSKIASSSSNYFIFSSLQ